jgi:hypothetical protein
VARVGPRAVPPSTPGSYLAEGEWAQDSEGSYGVATVISPAGEKASLKYRDLAGSANSTALGTLPERVAVVQERDWRAQTLPDHRGGRVTQCVIAERRHSYARVLVV